MVPKIAPALDRAIAVIRSNRYFVLATLDEEGPWAAALTYVPVSPNRLYFVSREWSRHSRAIRGDARVAGCISDSRAAAEEVESIQFAGRCVELRGKEDETAVVLQRASIRDKAPMPTSDDIRQLAHSTDQCVYRVEIEHAFVLDQNAWFTNGVDAREPVEIDAVLAAIEPAYLLPS